LARDRGGEGALPENGGVVAALPWSWCLIRRSFLRKGFKEFFLMGEV
jgi:hypothetical protein